MLSPADLLRIAALRPPLKARALPFIADVEAATGKQVRIPPRGGVRSPQDQIDLWNDRANNPYPVAQPGTSRHEFASALDFNIVNGTAADYMTAALIADRYQLDSGIYFTPPDPVHLQLRETLADARAAYVVMKQERSMYWLIGGTVVAGVLLLFLTSED